jgi:hypothetical protein
MFRRVELAQYGAAIVWLSPELSSAVYREALACCSQQRYGLAEDAFVDHATCDVGDSLEVGSSWLSERLDNGDDSVRLVFGESEVCEVSTSFFIKEWANILMPAQDDVVVLPAAGDWVLLNCHEEFWEFGRRKPGGSRPTEE